MTNYTNIWSFVLKIAYEMSKIQKSVIVSLCPYLLSYKAHYHSHELGRVDE